MSAGEDQSDVESVLAGNLAAFEGIVYRWQGPLINLAYRFCRDRGRAEDMAQEAFLRAYRGLKQWRKDAAFSTWLFALATNLYRSELRKIPAGTVALDEIEELANGSTSDENLDKSVRDRAVRRAVYSLPPKYREALILFYFHEMDISAAAHSLGLPEGTLKARLFRAKQILRRKIPEAWVPTHLKEAR